MVEKIRYFLDKIDEIKKIITCIAKQDGRSYLVGGSVRDLLLKRNIKDLDIEVHNLALDVLESCLQKFGPVSLVGKQFGVLKLHGTDIDWSLPRKDSKGRKPQVIIDKNLSLQEACKRRDVTINAMAIDLNIVCEKLERLRKCSEEEKEVDWIKELEIIDYFGGIKDLQNRTLRAVDKDLFIEDPLRFYRVVQFISRFDMVPDDELESICKQMDLRDVTQGGEIARERIYEEIKKLLLKSKKTSQGFRWLQRIGRLQELFPELGNIVGVMQRKDYHPEGDVFEHTMQALDATTLFPESLDKEKKFLITLGVLCHDLGKAEKTDEQGHSKGHDIAGVPLAKNFLHRFTKNSMLIRGVCKLVRYHRMPLVLVEQESGLKAYKRLAIKLAPEVSLQDLFFVAWCDVRGRNSKEHRPLENGFKGSDGILQKFIERIKEASVEHGPEKPVLQGKDLLDIVEPGPRMGELLKKAYTIQIDEGIRDKEELKKRVL